MYVVRKFSYSIVMFLFQTTMAASYDGGLPQSSLKQSLGEGYYQAEKLSEEVRPEIEKYARVFHEDPDLMEAVIFPELIRFNSIFDAIQIGSLITLYTRWGDDYADFSVGYFQMKPSFAEQIERSALEFADFGWVTRAGFSGLKTTNDFEGRKLRIERLRSLTWQVKYLGAFLKICRSRYRIRKINVEYNVRLLATAYNAGYHRTLKKTTPFLSKKLFYTGQMDNGSRFNYSSIAWLRFNELKMRRKALRVAI